MLHGPHIDIRRAERADLPQLAAWNGDEAVNGEFENFDQMSLAQMEKEFEADPDERWYIAQDKGGTPIGFLAHGKCGGGCWIGYVLEPEVRGRGHGTEAVQLIVDYLFLHKDIGRIQAETHPANAASRRVLREGRLLVRGPDPALVLHPGGVARHRHAQHPARRVGRPGAPAGRAHGRGLIWHPRARTITA